MTDDPCWCNLIPMEQGSFYGRIGRCNHCWNGLVESKNALVRENIELLHLLEKERGRDDHRRE